MLGKDGRPYNPFYDFNHDGKLDPYERAVMEDDEFAGYNESDSYDDDEDEDGEFEEDGEFDEDGQFDEDGDIDGEDDSEGFFCDVDVFDFDDDDDDEEEDADILDDLEAAGLDRTALEYADADDRYWALREAGFDPDDF